MKDENPQPLAISCFVGCADLVKSLILVEKCGIIITERKRK